MVTEFWSGWFDHWGEEHHAFEPTDFEERLSTILKHNASVNFYMFVGGTNFGFWNGANHDPKDGYLPTVTSYDYDAPISENGDITPKFAVIRKLIMKYGLGPVDWIDTPPNAERKGYGRVDMVKSLMYTDMMDMLSDVSSSLRKPVSMERLDINNNGGQGYGWILYRTAFTQGEKLSFRGDLKDSFQVFLNGKPITKGTWETKPEAISLPASNQLKNTLDIFVENCGRVNFKATNNSRHILNQQHKGILGEVLLDGKVLENWLHVPYEFNHKMRESLKALHMWKPYQAQYVPTAYYAKLSIPSQPVDTFLDMTGWEKGIVLLNGYNLGRYWNEKGPQTRLYVPAPLLVKGDNDVVVFELFKPHDSVAFMDSPGLSPQL